MEEKADPGCIVPRRLETQEAIAGQKPFSLRRSGRYVGKFPQMIAIPSSMVDQRIPLEYDGTTYFSISDSISKPKALTGKWILGVVRIYHSQHTSDENTGYRFLVEIGTEKAECAYKPPIKKIIRIWIFRRSSSCNLGTTRAGKANIVTSMEALSSS